MDCSTDYTSCSVTTFDPEPVPAGHPVRGVYKFESRNKSAAELLDFLTSRVNLLIDLCKDERGEGIQLRFYLRQYKPDYFKVWLDTNVFLSLHVDVVGGGEGTTFGFLTSLDELDEHNAISQNYLAPTQVIIESKGDREGKLVGETNWHVKRESGEVGYVLKREYFVTENVRLGLSVTPLKCQYVTPRPSSEQLFLKSQPLAIDTCGTTGKSKVNNNAQEDCIPCNLKLESKDGRVFSVHKSILSAQGPVLKARIEYESKKGDFNGTIQLSNVNGVPLRLILQWLYTSEMDGDQWDAHLNEMLQAGRAFKMAGLLSYLDERMVTLCTPERSEALYEIAKRYKLSTTMEYISSFEKEGDYV